MTTRDESLGRGGHGCSPNDGAPAVTATSRVTLHLVGTLHDGEEFDSTRDGTPLALALGKGEALPAFERAILGMSPGKRRRFVIPAAEAYGKRIARLEATLPRSALTGAASATPGTVIQLEMEDGSIVPGTLIRATPDDVTVDLNHPLAGQDLHFDVEMVSVDHAGTDLR